jgi:serine phosphatase RsbU (regulator of sigma subunit)
MFFNAKTDSLKKRLVLSYIALILTVGLLVSLIYYIYSFSMLEKQTYHAAQSIQKLAKLNMELHKNYMQPLAKKFILAEAKNTANELSRIITVSGGFNLKKIKNNKIIKAIVKSKIKQNNKYIGDLTIVRNNGHIVMSSDETVRNHSYYDIREKYKKLFMLVRDGLQKKEFSGYYNANPLKTDSGDIYRKFLAGARIPNTPLYVISSVYVHPYITPLIKKSNEIENREMKLLTAHIHRLTKNSIFTLLLISLIVLFFLIFMSMFVANWLAKKISKPIVSLKDAVIKISKGNFNTQVKEYGTEETIQLAKTFNKLGKSLKNYIANLEKEIEKRKRVESEINIARNIQQSLLPSVTKEFNRIEFSIYADLLPAKEVAGDFYDFFYIDKEKSKLAIILGDVSGKGIPAALFMGIIRTLLRNKCLIQQFDNPAELLEEVNQIVCIDNTECMFVTLFVAFYDIKSSNFSFANAGHHPAIKIKNDSTTEEFGSLSNTLLGIYPSVKYKNDSITLKSGESIFLYTDGISKATSPKNALYEVKRIKNKLQETNRLCCKNICKKLFNDVIEFQHNTLFDDMTVLILKIKG